MKASPALLALLALALCPACDSGDKKPDRPDVAAPKKADGPADAKKPEAAAGRVFFVSPADGATVAETFDVEFGVEGKQVRAAGATERDPGFGHHHVLIDVGALDDKVIVPKDEKHLHYGDGATKATLKLSPGKHTLTMQFADGAHRSYGPDWASTITVEVKAADADAAADGAAADGAAADGAAADGAAAAK